MSLLVSEMFGPTIQGEGPHAGRRCSFVRLGLCNLSCSWCDTPYTWDWTGKNGTTFNRAVELRHMSIEQVIEDLNQRGENNVVITGGEPLVQRKALAELVTALDNEMYDIEIETNGTHPPLDYPGFVIHYNVSPKLAHSGDPAELRIKVGVLAQFAREDSVAFKFVCQGSQDLEEIGAVVEAAGILDTNVWIMPEGRDTDTLAAHLGAVAEEAISRGWNITSRLHVEIWGDRRGV